MLTLVSPLKADSHDSFVSPLVPVTDLFNKYLLNEWMGDV